MAFVLLTLEMLARLLGLIRAYGGGARLVLREAPKVTLIPKSTIRVSVESSLVGALYDCAAKAGGSTSEEEYDSDGNLSLSITCETSVVDNLRERLTDATRGSVVFRSDNDDY
uniref:Proliferating cell nuclear antigen n=1 Tax=Grammatophora oceanica TaxID=210454 RepID=A0A7S1UTC7_9STRA|mmetsp:Transcript_21991/g.32766  ORF Transcript_21991/g.32766 Transcript_21991/m.32766 type:complete len:113 (+) Transcript_21991:68-406(+)